MPHDLGVPKHEEQRHLLAKGRVLVVDEEPVDRAYYQTVLQRTGLTVITCGSYSEAMQRLMAERFDLIVLSQGSAAFEGRRVLERALAVDRNRQVLVVAHSLNMGCYLESMQMGARDYLVEPVSEHEMVRAAETCLSSRPVAA